MNPKNTWLLVIVTAGLFAFIFFFERHLRPAAPSATRVLPDFNGRDVSSIQIQLAHQLEIRLERTNGGWQFVKPLLYPAQAALVENLLQAVTDLSPQMHISAQDLKGRPTINEEYGFDNPQATLVFAQGDEQRQLKLGRLTAPGDQIYAQVVGLDRVDIIDADFFKKFIPRQPNEWRDPAFVNLRGRAFDRVTALNGGQILFELRRDATNQPWRMEHPVRARADNPRIAELLRRLQDLRVTKFETDDAQADLESFGLQPAGLELDFDNGTNRLLAAQFGKSPTNDSRSLFARCNGQSNVVLVPAEFIKPWAAGFQEFRDRHLVRLTGGLPDVVEVIGAESFTLERKTNDSWRVTKPLELPADTNRMREFLVNLDSLEVMRAGNQVAVNDAALDSDFPGFGLDQPARKYILKRNPPAGASNRVMAELDFGLVKDGRIFARRGDRPEETSLYAISPDDFARLPSRALDLRERRIWTFSEDDVAKIIIRHDGQAQELLHKSQNHWSIAVGSQGLINELQIEVGAQELGFLEAQDWIERGDPDKARYGFNSNSLRISVELKGEVPPRALAFDLGARSPRGLRYGDAKLEDGENWIFEIPAVLMDRLTSYFNLPENTGP